jgi:tetratricopeptide (TPR) repeat protein
VARAIESAHPEKLDAQAALLAHHWEEANEAREAGRWHSRAARWIGRKNQTEARRHWSAVRVLLARADPEPELIELAVEARAHLILLGRRSGASDQELDELLAEARNLSGESDNVHALAFALSHYAYAKTLSGHLAAAMDPLEDATRLADRLVDRTLKLVVTTTRANILYIGGSLEQALTVNEEGIELSGGDAGMGSDVLGTSPYLLLLAHQALVLTAMGHPTRADQSLKMLYRLARQRSDPIASVMLHSGEAFRAELTGECQRALGLVSESMAVTRDLEFSNLATLRDLHVGITYLAAERWDEAASALERGLQRMQHQRLGQVNQPRVLACLARVYRVRGEATRAEEAAREAVRLSRASGARWYCADACIALTEVLIAAAGADARGQIESTLAEAQHLIDETGARGFQPLVHRVRADLARLLGDDASFERELREAHRLYVEMGATGHAKRLEKKPGR